MATFSPHPLRSSLLRPHALADERLARRVGEADEQAFTELYARHHQALYRYCRAILRDETDAQDALQSTWTRALVALRSGRRDAPLRPWLYRIAHNESVTVLRRRSRPADPVPDRPAPQASAEQQVIDRERFALLLADLRALSDRPRGALIMRELDGLSHEEIASALETSVAGAKQSIYEARRELADFAQARAADCDDICRRISNGDGRVLRGRQIRAHLRSCPACAAFAQGINVRHAGLNGMLPLLPAAGAAAILRSVLTGAHHGGAAIAAGAAGAAGTSATGTTATGTTATATTAGAGTTAAGTMTSATGASTSGAAVLGLAGKGTGVVVLAKAAAGVAVIGASVAAVTGTVGSGPSTASQGTGAAGSRSAHLIADVGVTVLGGKRHASSVADGGGGRSVLSGAGAASRGSASGGRRARGTFRVGGATMTTHGRRAAGAAGGHGQRVHGAGSSAAVHGAHSGNTTFGKGSSGSATFNGAATSAAARSKTKNQTGGSRASSRAPASTATPAAANRSSSTASGSTSLISTATAASATAARAPATTLAKSTARARSRRAHIKLRR